MADKKPTKPATTEVKDSIAAVVEKAEKGDAVAQNTVGVWHYTGKGSIKQDYKEALKWWARSAQQDNCDAIGNMAMCYQLGHGSKQDSALAVSLYKKAIEKGNKGIIPQHETIVKNAGSVFSALLLHDCYANGIGVKKDAAKAASYQEIAAKGGHVESQYATALALLNNKQADKAIYWFKKASDNGHVGATYYYGNLTFNGMGIAQDKQKGIQYLSQAAGKGFTMAYARLAQICYEGDGIEKDYAKAFGFAQKGAAKNNQTCKWILAMCYINGNGTNKDYYLGTQWLAETANTHSKEIASFLSDDKDGIYSQYIKGLKKYYVDKNYAEAITFFTKVDKAKVAEGKTMLGVCQANRNYEKKNEKKGVKTLEKASLESNAAAYYLSSMYETGTGCQEDKAKALDLLKKAADGGIAFAQCKLGDMYMSGNGVTRDFTKAAQYYLKAEAQNHLTASAAKNLIDCYNKKVTALPDLDNSKERIAQLEKQKENNNLSKLLSIVK
ncbi:MAG: sel1 repeat family protein [Prevotellaceae bacterium]|nr:sel1 repeat family protein [Candidatus Minthosoma caballi]